MTLQQKQNVWYIAVMLLMVSELFGASALVFSPLMLGVTFVGFWAFDVN